MHEPIEIPEPLVVSRRLYRGVLTCLTDDLWTDERYEEIGERLISHREAGDRSWRGKHPPTLLGRVRSIPWEHRRTWVSNSWSDDESEAVFGWLLELGALAGPHEWLCVTGRSWSWLESKARPAERADEASEALIELLSATAGYFRFVASGGDRDLGRWIGDYTAYGKDDDDEPFLRLVPTA